MSDLPIARTTYACLVIALMAGATGSSRGSYNTQESEYLHSRRLGCCHCGIHFQLQISLMG